MRKNKIKYNLQKISSSIKIHFGKNPRRGGNPPKDNKEKEKKNLRKKFL